MSEQEQNVHLKWFGIGKLLPFLKPYLRGILLMMTANLRTTHGIDKEGNPIPSIEDRYGDLVLSRLRSVVKIVQFKGKDMRGTSQPRGMKN